MDLKQSMSLETLGLPLQKAECLCESARISAQQIARQIFAAAAEQGTPYLKITSEQWAKKWLASKEFVLVDIQASAVAVPHAPFNPNKVQADFHCTADSLEPIVVDLNKRNIGRAGTGYLPPVIVVDGKHRHTALTLQGRGTIKAWVGVDALDQVIKPSAKAVSASAQRFFTQSRGEVTNRLFAGMGGVAVPRQDVAQNGAAPSMRIPALKNTGAPMLPYTKGMAPVVSADSADITDSIEEDDGSDTNQTSTGKCQMNDEKVTKQQSPGSERPTLGTGRYRGGASGSEMTKILGAKAKSKSKLKAMKCDCKAGKHVEGCAYGSSKN